MTFRLFGASRRQIKPKPASPDPGKRIEAQRPVRVYSLLLPPTLPRDRR
jgi:hypothetical protein